MAQAANVLLLWDTTGQGTPALTAALTAAGNTVTLSPASEGSYNGTNPPPGGFDVVVHLNGTSHLNAMPSTGRNALIAYVQGGGGFIHGEWNAYQVDNSSTMLGFEDLTLLTRTGGNNGGATVDIVSAQASHPVVAGLPSSFFFPGGTNQGPARTFATDPSTVLATDASNGDAVVVREYQSGRIVGFHSAGNFLSGAFQDSDLQQLYVNAVGWAGGTGTCPDADGDGATAIACGGTDCDDSDANNFPGNPEVCDGADNDCDTVADNGLTFVDYYADGDGDGVGGAFSANTCDGAPAGTVTSSGDCDDSDGANFPGNTEVCDGADNDCNGLDDAGNAGVDGEETDDDGDGQWECQGDCDDSDIANWNGNMETCDGADNDCDTVADNGLTFVDYYADGDGDGVGTAFSANTCDGAPTGTVAASGDCDDADPNNFPGNTEFCDGQDNDCDASTDYTGGEGDSDGDGFVTCADCDDGNAATYPGAPELCDGEDNDCDPSTEAAGGEGDLDGDGDLSCSDCNDADPSNFNGNTEACDGVDNDCDGATWADADGEIDFDQDGALSCSDCDDNDGANFSGNLEVCDGFDNDCNGLADFVETSSGDDDDSAGDDDDSAGDDDDSAASSAGMLDELDLDGDGVLACAGDCDDDDPLRADGFAEVCDGIDNDCDESVGDEEEDGDGDGFSPCAGDCDDLSPYTYDGAPEICDGADNDCDEVVPADEADVDADGWLICEGDCDDDRPEVNPDQFEDTADACDDGADNDCDGAIDLEDPDCEEFAGDDDDDDTGDDDDDTGDDDDDDSVGGLVPDCNCSLGERPMSALGLLLLPLFGLARRRRTRPSRS